MAKLTTIIRHEYLTIVRQPSFWIMMVALPLLIAGIFLLTFLGEKASTNRIEEITSELQDTVIVDESGIINVDVVAAAGMTLAPASDVAVLKEAVRQDEQSVLVVYPADIATSKQYQVYLSSMDFTINQAATTLASDILRTSVFLPLGSADVIALAQDGAESQVTMYRDGEQTAGFGEYIAPGLFMVLFYVVLMFSVSYMLSSVSEEKENRSMEMLLTYVKPRTVIVGKLLAVSLVTLTQILFFAGLALLAYVIGVQLLNMTSLTLPFGLSLANIPLHGWPIFFGASYLIVGFLLFAGLMTATAAATPSSKESGGFSSVFFLSAFMPFYFMQLVVTDPSNPVVQFLTYFPLTSPTVDLMRNTVGNMSLGESWLALGAMTLAMVASIWLAVKAFRLGALEFGNTISIRKLFKKS